MIESPAVMSLAAYSSICFWFYGNKCLSRPYVLHIQKTINNNPCGGVILLGTVYGLSFLCGSRTDQAECSSGGHWGGVWFWSITLWLRRGKELAINIGDGGSGCCWSYLRTLCVHRRNTWKTSIGLFTTHVKAWSALSAVNHSLF